MALRVGLNNCWLAWKSKLVRRTVSTVRPKARLQTRLLQNDATLLEPGDGVIVAAWHGRPLAPAIIWSVDAYGLLLTLIVTTCRDPPAMTITGSLRINVIEYQRWD